MLSSDALLPRPSPLTGKLLMGRSGKTAKSLGAVASYHSTLMELSFESLTPLCQSSKETSAGPKFTLTTYVIRWYFGPRFHQCLFLSLKTWSGTEEKSDSTLQIEWHATVTGQFNMPADHEGTAIHSREYIPSFLTRGNCVAGKFVQITSVGKIRGRFGFRVEAGGHFRLKLRTIGQSLETGSPFAAC